MAASSRFFDHAARRILAAHLAPDLRGCVVVLPNYHAAQPLAQALMRVAGVPALLLPDMVTLNDWAQSMPLAAPVIGDSRRGALLYQQLRRQKWFGDAELWGMTQELLKLFDELTQSLAGLPQDAEAFAATVEQAYRSRQNETLQLEARLVFELWHAMQAGDGLDAARARQQRLAQLAAQADKPLYVLRTSDWDALEQHFLDEYARRAPVEVFDSREMHTFSPALSRLRERGYFNAPLPLAGEGLGGETGNSQSMLCACRAVPACQPERALQVRESAPHFFAATSLEQQARAAAMQVRLWLQEGKRDIAIVAQDRVAARRTRALLERAEVLVADETGWTFATLSVATVLERWLTALQSDFYHHDLLDLLKSPFIFADLAAGERKAMVYRLEQLLRERGVVEGLENFIALAAGEQTLHAPLARLRQAAALLEQNRKHTLAEWLAVLGESLAMLGIDAGLRQDEAGQQLLRALDAWQQELQDDDGRYRFAEWRRWLAQQLDIETFRDTGIDSPVRFTHLAATRGRAFDAVLLLGCDADQLPGAADGGYWFNDAVRAALGLPTRAFQAQRQHDDLHALLAMNDTVLVTWQKEQDGEPRLLSPFLQLLRDEHERMHGDDLAGELAPLTPTLSRYPLLNPLPEAGEEANEKDNLQSLRERGQTNRSAIFSLDERELHAYLAAEEAHRAALSQSAQPAPKVVLDAVPESVSISGYNSLIACPYQFYARHILRLNELDEVSEAIEKRDYGERVHGILQRFHEQYPQVSGHDMAEMETALRQISDEVFADLLAQDFAARAWLARWVKSLPAYLAWQAENEAEGWRYAESEQAFDWPLEGIRLKGRIDRLDVRCEEKRVLDYKTQSDALLRNKLKEPGEDVQLACYAYAHEAADAAFVSIDNGKVKLVEPKDDVPLLAQLNAERLEQVMAAMRGGAGLPANGIDAACAYCEMRGVCRKGEWVSEDRRQKTEDSSPLPLAGEGLGERVEVGERVDD